MFVLVFMRFRAVVVRAGGTVLMLVLTGFCAVIVGAGGTVFMLRGDGCICCMHSRI